MPECAAPLHVLQRATPLPPCMPTFQRMAGPDTGRVLGLGWALGCNCDSGGNSALLCAHCLAAQSSEEEDVNGATRHDCMAVLGNADAGGQALECSVQALECSGEHLAFAGCITIFCRFSGVVDGGLTRLDGLAGAHADAQHVGGHHLDPAGRATVPQRRVVAPQPRIVHLPCAREASHPWPSLLTDDLEMVVAHIQTVSEWLLQSDCVLSSEGNTGVDCDECCWRHHLADL